MIYIHIERSLSLFIKVDERDAMMKDFSLKKWYLDAADQRGNLYIGYHLSLQWQKLVLHGYQHAWRTSKHPVLQTQGGFIQQPLPVWKNRHRLVWQPHHLDAAWDSLADGLEETLLTTDKGEILWRCMQPKAQASINLPGLSFAGWGYTECIEITLPVWELPFNRLSWGRSHSQNHYLVWIGWEGSTTQHLLWHNGKREVDWTMTNQKLVGANWQLHLDDALPLRQGKLLSTVLKPYSNITQLLPQTMFLADESKWYSVGLLESQTGTEPAVIIYEEVIW